MRSLCIYCGSSNFVDQVYIEAGKNVGNVLARRGITLIYGGSKTGIMGAVADGVLERGGKVIGVNVRSMNTEELTHHGLSEMIITESMQQRKLKMFELADAFIALPGGFGTFDELFETITWAQIGEHEKPIGLLNVKHYYDPLWAMLTHAQEEGFIFKEHIDMLCSSDDIEKLLNCLGDHRPNKAAVDRWMKQTK